MTPVSIVKSTSDVGQVEEESPYKGFGGAAVIDISAFGEWGGEDTDDEDAGGGGSNAKSARDGTSSKLKSRVPQQDYQTSGMDKAAAIAKMKGKLRQAGSSSSGAGAEPRKRNESVLKKSSLDSIRSAPYEFSCIRCPRDMPPTLCAWYTPAVPKIIRCCKALIR